MNKKSRYRRLVDGRIDVIIDNFQEIESLLGSTREDEEALDQLYDAFKLICSSELKRRVDSDPDVFKEIDNLIQSMIQRKMIVNQASFLTNLELATMVALQERES